MASVLVAGGGGGGSLSTSLLPPDRKQCQWLEDGNENWSLARVPDLPLSRCVAEASGHSSELLLPYLSVEAVQREATWVSHTTGAWSVTTGKKVVLGLGKAPATFHGSDVSSGLRLGCGQATE